MNKQTNTIEEIKSGLIDEYGELYTTTNGIDLEEEIEDLSIYISKNYISKSQAQKEKEEAEYNAVKTFFQFCKNGKEHHNFPDKYLGILENEYELFMARGYAGHRLNDIRAEQFKQKEVQNG